MNIYIATKNNMVGLVLTGTHNKTYYFKAFQTQTTDKEAQTILATQTAVTFARNNRLEYAGDCINIYTKDTINLAKIKNNEYLSRFNYPIELKTANTEEEKQRMILATTEINMELRRQIIKRSNCR